MSKALKYPLFNQQAFLHEALLVICYRQVAQMAQSGYDFIHSQQGPHLSYIEVAMQYLRLCQ
jgi:hypothetical protein